MTFRSRLLLTILAVVVFTTAVSLVVAQRQHGAAYRTLGDELLRGQTQWFQRLQSGRQAQAADTAARLAGSVRLFAALEAKDPAVYQIAGDELRLDELDFFRLLDGNGRLIEPPAAHGGAAPPFPDWVVPRAAAVAKVGNRVELGYLIAPEQTSGQEYARGPGARGARAAPEAGGKEVGPGRLYRILAAPIRSFDQLVGTLLIGQRVAALGDPAGGGGAIPMTHSAVWLDGQLAGAGVPQNVRAPLRAALGGGAGSSERQIHSGESRYRYQLTALNPESSFPTAQLVSLFAMDGFVAEQRALRWRIALTGAAAALLAGLVAIALSRQLANPLRSLVFATERIGGGDFEHRLAPSAIPEFDRLARAFNQMAADLALKERYRSVLNQIADAEVAEAMVAGRIELGGELREVTVMFCDIREYTALAKASSPEVVIELLNAHYGELARVVREHGGVINQFVGDAIMALFGAPKQYGDDTVRAVRCAQEMIAARERLNRHARIPVHVGIGIASGAVVAGCIGDERRADYTAVGEHVNLASRLAGSAAAGEILIDDGTRRRLDDDTGIEAMPPMSLKGFGADVSVFRVARRTAA